MATPFETLIEETYAHRRAENFTDAHKSADAALTLAREKNDNLLLAQALLMIGQIERDEDRYEAAVVPYEEAVSILRKNANTASLAHAVRHLADLETERKHYHSAEAYYVEALSLYDALESVAPLTLANALRAYAVLKDHLEETKQARALWSRTKSLYEEAGIEAGVEECAQRLAR